MANEIDISVEVATNYWTIANAFTHIGGFETGIYIEAAHNSGFVRVGISHAGH